MLYFMPHYIEISDSEDLQSEEHLNLVIESKDATIVVALNREAVSQVLIRLGEACRWRDQGGWPSDAGVPDHG
jgi:hypothetical protein